MLLVPVFLLETLQLSLLLPTARKNPVIELMWGERTSERACREANRFICFLHISSQPGWAKSV